MGWNPFTLKRPVSETAAYTAKAEKAEEARRANARIDRALNDMAEQSAEWGKRRAALRAKCPLSNHDRCHSH